MIERLRGGPEGEILPGTPVLEQIRFMRIVQAETTVQGRRLIDWWVCPHDAHPDSGEFLDRTLNLLWRTDERQEENNG